LAEISYLGHACFRLRGKEGIVLCDPYHPTLGLELGKPTAHIVTLSHGHPGHSNAAAVRPVQTQPFVIDGPGEYEVRGILLTGVRSYHDKNKGLERGFNTIYVIRLDDISYCHLGDLGHDLSQSQLEEIGNVDVLFVPVGGEETIGPAEAVSVISQLEPRLVIPMHYAPPQSSFARQLLPLEGFIHEMGLKDLVSKEKVSVTASSLPGEGEEMRVLVMQPSNN